MTVLFWNLGPRKVGATLATERLVALVEKTEADIVALAEADRVTARFLKCRPRGNVWVPKHKPQEDKTTLLVRSGTASVERIGGSPRKRSTFYEVSDRSGNWILGVVHHIDVRNHPPAARTGVAQEEANLLRGKMRQKGLPAIVIGDFNMDPYEEGMVSSLAYHALPTREIVSRGSRTVLFTETEMFYNPVWSYLGDLSQGMPGSFGGAPSGVISPGWHALDQVLISSALLERVDWEGTHWISAEGHRERPSDHRPVHDEMDHYALVLRLS